jgi:hypothetical protein
MTPDPRTALTVSLAACAAALVSPRGAALALVATGVQAALVGLSLRALALRLLPIASGFAAFLLLLPFAARPVLDLTLRGLAVAAATVVLGAVASWSALVSVLQGLGLPPAGVAYLVILARHASGVAEETRRASLALRTRGGFDRPGNLGRSTAALLARVLDRALLQADHVARALELRGFEGRVLDLPAFRFRLVEAPHYALAFALCVAVVFEAGPWSR